jgi:TolB-like protein
MINKYMPFILFVIFTFFPLDAQEPRRTIPTSEAPDKVAEEAYVFRQKPTIAILPFTNANAQAKETEFGRTISAMLATAMRNDTNFQVLERSEVQKVLEEQVLGSSGVTMEKAQQIGKLYNVEVILLGDVSLIDKTLHIDARLIDTENSQVVVALYGTCQDLAKIRDVVEKLGKDLEQNYLRQWMGSISIASQPAGAEVYLENKFIGLTDDAHPLTVADLLEGNYQLKFIRGGYNDWEGTISVLAKMERTVKVSLIAKPGSMNIYSEPPGASIYLDNNPAGLTPMSLKKVAEGEHEIRLVKENYKEWAQKVTVRSFQPTDVKATLEVSPGMLTINSNPSKASIYLKGSFVAETPHTLTNIPPGEVVIRIDKDGFEEWTTSILIQPNSHEVIDAVLKEKVGALSITSRPDNATVILTKRGQESGQVIGKTPILNFTTTIGDYRVSVEKQDYFTDVKQVLVQNKQLVDVQFDLKEKPGTILVETNPENARIFLDGFYKGRSPFVLEGINRGEYQIDLDLPFARETRKIAVEPNRQTHVKADFNKSKRYLLSMLSIGAASLLLHSLAK